MWTSILCSGQCLGLQVLLIFVKMCFLTCSFSLSLSQIMMLLIQVFFCDWNTSGQAQGCWGKCCSHSSALRKSDPKWVVAATRMRVMARTPYFQNIFLWQKTEKGFHSVKMAMSLLVTPAERWGALMSGHFLLYIFLFHQHLLFVLCEYEEQIIKHKKNPPKPPKDVIWENKQHWSCSFKSCITARWDEEKPEKQLWSQMLFNKSSFYLSEYLPKTSVTWVWLSRKG